jgi:hypothetical protein
MSRVISKAYADSLRDPGAKPPLALLPEDDGQEADQATTQAILALTSAVGQLCHDVVSSMPKGGDPALLAAVDRIAAGQAALLEQLKAQKPTTYRFKVVRDQYGDLDYVDAIPGE